MRNLFKIIILISLISLTSVALAFDIRDYFNFDILKNNLTRSTQNFQFQELSPVRNTLFQQLSDKIYQATGINLLNIWTGIVGLFANILSKTSDFLKALL